MTTSMSSDIIHQWVDNVKRYSSQYDEYRWNAGQVRGPPKVYPKYGDIPGAWAMKTIDAHQFLEVEFAEAVFVAGIDIYETYHAGGVSSIQALDEDGKWQKVYDQPVVTVIKQSRIFSPQLSLDELKCRTKNIRVEVDCTACRTWVEIDAIQLRGRKFMTGLRWAGIIWSKEISNVSKEKEEKT